MAGSKRALSSQLSSLVAFAEGLQLDYDALKAAMTLEWSNGPVEGQINRLKMLKRQMYGRASLELLSRRFLWATQYQVGLNNHNNRLFC